MFSFSSIIIIQVLRDAIISRIVVYLCINVFAIDIYVMQMKGHRA